jgi:AbiV family abortive infection protein
MSGAQKCLEVAVSRLDEATVLLNEFANQAAVLFSFAVEEFGKAMLLRAAYETQTDPAVIEGFYDHQVKLTAAADHIPEKFLLLTSAVLQRGAFDSATFAVGAPLDWEDRLAGLYVEWEDAWRYGARLDVDTLKRSIEGVRSVSRGVFADWIKCGTSVRNS